MLIFSSILSLNLVVKLVPKLPTGRTHLWSLKLDQFWNIVLIMINFSSWVHFVTTKNDTLYWAHEHTMKTQSTFLHPLGMRQCTLLSFERMSTAWRLEGLKTHSFVTSECTSAPSLSPWVHEFIVKARRPKNLLLCPFGVRQCAFLGSFLFLL